MHTCNIRCSRKMPQRVMAHIHCHTLTWPSLSRGSSSRMWTTSSRSSSLFKVTNPFPKWSSTSLTSWTSKRQTWASQTLTCSTRGRPTGYLLCTQHDGIVARHICVMAGLCLVYVPSLLCSLESVSVYPCIFLFVLFSAMCGCHQYSTFCFVP